MRKEEKKKGYKEGIYIFFLFLFKEYCTVFCGFVVVYLFMLYSGKLNRIYWFYFSSFSYVVADEFVTFCSLYLFLILTNLFTIVRLSHERWNSFVIFGMIDYLCLEREKKEITKNCVKFSPRSILLFKTGN